MPILGAQPSMGARITMKLELQLNLKISKKWAAAIVGILWIAVDVTAIAQFFMATF